MANCCRKYKQAGLNRYACGADGGWLNRSVISDEELPDLIRLVGVKVKPKKIGGKNA